MARRKKLAVNVTVEGDTYKAGTFPPEDVAEKITNPKAWANPPKDEPVEDTEFTPVVDENVTEGDAPTDGGAAADDDN